MAESVNWDEMLRQIQEGDYNYGDYDYPLEKLEQVVTSLACAPGTLKHKLDEVRVRFVAPSLRKDVEKLPVPIEDEFKRIWNYYKLPSPSDDDAFSIAELMCHLSFKLIAQRAALQERELLSE